MLQHISIENAKRVLQQQGSMQAAAWSRGLSGGPRLHDLFITIEGMTPSEYKNGGASIRISYAFAPTPFGEMLVTATPKGICRPAFAADRTQAVAELSAEYPAAQRFEEPPLHARALAVFGGGTPQTVPLNLKGTLFQLKVQQALLQIPAGRLKSHAHLAADIGPARAARTAGNAVGSNPVAVLIPCHRVIRESGVIGGYRWQRGRKIALLATELQSFDFGGGHDETEDAAARQTV